MTISHQPDHSTDYRVCLIERSDLQVLSLLEPSILNTSLALPVKVLSNHDIRSRRI